VNVASQETTRQASIGPFTFLAHWPMEQTAVNPPARCPRLAACARSQVKPRRQHQPHFRSAIRLVPGKPSTGSSAPGQPTAPAGMPGRLPADSPAHRRLLAAGGTQTPLSGSASRQPPENSAQRHARSAQHAGHYGCQLLLSTSRTLRRDHHHLSRKSRPGPQVRPRKSAAASPQNGQTAAPRRTGCECPLVMDEIHHYCY
jgi:hypothetical protein